MYKIAILGCENSHADNFLQVIREEHYEDIQVLGVFSAYEGAAEKLRDKYGVPVMERYDALVGQLDGVIITARHGDNHYKYAKPYLADGIPMLIDKPATCTEADARAFSRELESRQIPISGGSTLKHAKYIQTLKALVASGERGLPLGGFFRAPLQMENAYGNFFFYAQHLVQMVCEVFGYFPKAVRTCRNGKQVTCTLRYDSFDVTALYVDGSYVYYASVAFGGSVEGETLDLKGASSLEFRDFYRLLQGQEQQQSYAAFFAPVFIMNALYRSLESGAEEIVGSL